MASSTLQILSNWYFPCGVALAVLLTWTTRGLPRVLLVSFALAIFFSISFGTDRLPGAPALTLTAGAAELHQALWPPSCIATSIEGCEPDRVQFFIFVPLLVQWV